MRDVKGESPGIIFRFVSLLHFGIQPSNQLESNMSTFTTRSGRVIELLDNEVESDRAIFFTMEHREARRYGSRGFYSSQIPVSEFLQPVEPDMVKASVTQAACA